jgi:hypothetical protein
MTYQLTVSEDNDHRVIGNMQSMTAEQTLAALRHFRTEHPNVHVLLVDEDGVVLVDERRFN